MVTTTFYPHPVVGSVRASNWARMLPGVGWKPIVYCKWYGSTATRAMLDQHVHPACEVVYLNGPWAWMSQAERDKRVEAAGGQSPQTGLSTSRPPSWKTRVKRWLGSKSLAKHLLVPDVSVLFWRGVATQLRQAIVDSRAEILLTSSPPHSVHTVGFGVRSVPWVLDFQDPHLIDVRYGPIGAVGSLTRGKHWAFKARCHAEGAALIHANALHDRWVRMRFPGARHKSHLLEPMCPEDLAEGRLIPEPGVSGRRNVRVVGFIGEAEAVELAGAVRRLVHPASGTADGRGVAPHPSDHTKGRDIELRFVGKPPASADHIRSMLGERVVFTGPLVHDEAKRQIAGADLLVSHLSPYRASYNGISSKLFEFIAARKPVIQINPTAPDRHLLRGLGGTAMQVLKSPSEAELGHAIERGLSPEAAEGAQRGPAVDQFVREHSWRRHAEGLARVLEAAEAEWRAGR